MANEHDDERRETEERTDDEILDTDADLGGDDDDDLIDIGEDERGRETGRTGGTEEADPDIGGPGREPGTVDEPGPERGVSDEPGPERGVTDEPGPETGVTDERGIDDEPGATDPELDRDPGMTDTGATDTGITGTGATDVDMTDTGTGDSGMSDTGTGDTGMTDTGIGDDAPRTRVTDDDIGKDVLGDGGERIGIVAGVEGQHVHVDPDPGLADRIKAALGWGDTEGDDTYAIQQDQIQDVGGDSVRLRRM